MIPMTKTHYCVGCGNAITAIIEGKTDRYYHFHCLYPDGDKLYEAFVKQGLVEPSDTSRLPPKSGEKG